MTHNKLWKNIKDMGISDHLTYHLRNLYTGQKATVRTIHATMGWFKIGNEICRVCILSCCLFRLYPEYIMINARLDEAEAGIKTVRRNTNNHSYVDYTQIALPL